MHDWLPLLAACLGILVIPVRRSLSDPIWPVCHRLLGLGDVQAGFVLAVGLKFKSTRDRDALLQTWKKLATHTRSKEPGAMSYKWLVADNDPTNVLVYER